MAESPEPEAPTTAPEFAPLQAKAVDALANAQGQTSAADAIAESVWKVDGSTLTIQTQCSKTMLPMIVNMDAEKLVKAAVRDAGITKVVILPGVPNAAPKKPRAARAGSPEAKAKQHPMIQQAQRLFDAEIRNVIDLSEGN